MSNLNECAQIERSIITKFRKDIWSKFVRCISNYELIKENDKVMVCISGGKDSFLLAKCIQELIKHGRFKFEACYVVMNPGYSDKNLDLIKRNANRLGIDIEIFESDIFDVVNKIGGDSPCYLCARMRRGYLYNKAIELQKEKGYTFVHPFDDEDVIAGQGTIGLEILNQIENIDAVVVPIGGGGLISGVAFAIKNLKPNIKVYGVQAANAPSMYESIKQKSKITLDAVSTFADGIAVKHPGDLTYELVNKYVDEVVTVSEDEIAMSILTLIERQKLISEGAGATSVAAVLSDKIPVNNKNVVCVVSGGNIDVNILSRVLTRGLKYSGRNVSMQIALEDKPGQLVLVSTIISKCGGNIINVRYERSDLNMPISSCYLTIGMETKNFDHIETIKNELTKAGLKIVSVM